MKCPVGKLCGGCELAHLAYAKQGEQKQQEVQDLVNKAKLNIKVLPVHMAKSAFGYRNKVIYGFAKDKNKKVYSGLYAPKSHRVVNTKGCKMQPNLVNEILDEITHLVDSMKIELYSPKTGTGLLRHVLIRYAKDTNEVMVVFVTSSKVFPSRKNLVNALRAKFPQIKTIVQNINPRDTSIVLQDETIVLYGNGMISDKLCGLTFSFNASSFYQVNHDQCEVLYTLAKEMLDLNNTEKILDTYCGVGTIGLTLASSCRQVTGVEINKDAVEMARFNAKQNGIRNARFIAMDSTRFMQDAARNHVHYDAIILDPPRAGTTKEFIEAAVKLTPNKILYISCDPRTQVRDLSQFRRLGYSAQTMELVDMFPNTSHIETCVLLRDQRSTRNYVYVDYAPKSAEYMDKVPPHATYPEIKVWVLENHGLKVSSLYISQVKRKHGLPVGECYNKPKTEDSRQPQCPPEKEAAIEDALRHFRLID